MTSNFESIIYILSGYVVILFLIGYYAHYRYKQGKSIVKNSSVYILSITVFCTSWTFYGSIGRAATFGPDFILIFLGPSTTAFTWWFLLRKIIRITKENNITSIADFISSRYGKSQLLGAIITAVSILGMIPYIALQLKAVSISFGILTEKSSLILTKIPDIDRFINTTGFFTALLLIILGVTFGASSIKSVRRHEGLTAVIAFQGLVKLFSMLVIGIFVTYYLFDGFQDIFRRMASAKPQLFTELTTITASTTGYASWLTILLLSMGSIMLLPRQFHVMAVENSDETYIKSAMWKFPAYLFLMNLFVVPIAFAGILLSNSTTGADYFALTIPLHTNYPQIALLTFIGVFSAASGMIMTESLAISTMILNHLLMPAVLKLKPRNWFPLLLLNLKRIGIISIILLGYLYYRIVAETYMLADIGLISFAALIQLAPAFLGGLYWRRGNKNGAIIGITAGFLIWFYTLLLPSFVKAGVLSNNILTNGFFNISILKPTALFGITSLDPLSNCMFWSMFLNIGSYIFFSIATKQNETEKEQVKRFVDVFNTQNKENRDETKWLSKPITTTDFANLVSKFIGESQANEVIGKYLSTQKIDKNEMISEFELPNFKRFIERTLAGSIGTPAARAVVDSFISDMGSYMEPFYDAFKSVRSSLEESREALYVRLKASEIINRSTNLQDTMDNLLNFLNREFKFDLSIIRTFEEDDLLHVRSAKGVMKNRVNLDKLKPIDDQFINQLVMNRKFQFVNNSRNIQHKPGLSATPTDIFLSLAHIPINRGGKLTGVLSLFSASITGLFTKQFLSLLQSLASQLAQAIELDKERAAKEKEQKEKEIALMKNARVTRDMELAKQIQLALLPYVMPEIPGVSFAAFSASTAHIGGDYYDFFPRENGVIDTVIADVSGHNVGAALIMTETRSVLRSQIATISNPSAILAKLNEMLFHDLSRAELFITMFYIKYDTKTYTLTYSSAGHNHPLLYRIAEKRCIPLDAEGLIIGVKREVNFEEKHIKLESGDVLLLYTDGLTEMANLNGDMFGTERVSQLLERNHAESANKIIKTLFSEVLNFAAEGILQDDTSMVIMKIE